MYIRAYQSSLCCGTLCGTIVFGLIGLLVLTAGYYVNTQKNGTLISENCLVTGSQIVQEQCTSSYCCASSTKGCTLFCTSSYTCYGLQVNATFLTGVAQGFSSIVYPADQTDLNTVTQLSSVYVPNSNHSCYMNECCYGLAGTITQPGNCASYVSSSPCATFFGYNTYSLWAAGWVMMSFCFFCMFSFFAVLVRTWMQIREINKNPVIGVQPTFEQTQPLPPAIDMPPPYSTASLTDNLPMQAVGANIQPFMPYPSRKEDF